ncbi:hypothetical protein [Alteromonas sp. AO-Serp]|nr:hypothetical protein [Alteromonas sp. AO-Serp]
MADPNANVDSELQSIREANSIPICSKDVAHIKDTTNGKAVNIRE